MSARHCRKCLEEIGADRIVYCVLCSQKVAASRRQAKQPPRQRDSFFSDEFDEHGYDEGGWTNADWRMALNPDEGDRG